MASSLRFGLRGQIVVALSVVFVISFALLGTAAVRLTQAASEVERARSARLYAGALAAALDAGRPTGRAQIDALLDAWAARDTGQHRDRGVDLRAIRIVDRDGERYQRGAPPAEAGAQRSAGGRRRADVLARALGFSRALAAR